MATSTGKELKGQELLALIESMPTATRKEIAIAAGYKNKSGRAQVAKYYEAFIDAKGLDAGGTLGSKRGKPVSYVLHPQKTGLVVIGRPLWESIGIDRDDEIQLVIDRESPEAEIVGPRIILYKRVDEESKDPEFDDEEGDDDEESDD